MAGWNAALHPRDALGRFRPTYVPGSGSVEIGQGGAYYGVKTGAEFRVGTKGRQVLVKAIVGYKGPPTGSRAASGTKATARQSPVPRTPARGTRTTKSAPGRKVSR